MPQHIDPTTHEHGKNAKVYTYEADYDADDDRITWQAVVHQADVPERCLKGEIAITSPAVSSMAETVVRDEIVKRIDRLEDGERPGVAP